MAKKKKAANTNVPKVADPIGDITIQPGVVTPVPPGMTVMGHTAPDLPNPDATDVPTVQPYQCPVCRLVPVTRPCNYCADTLRDAESKEPPAEEVPEVDVAVLKVPLMGKFNPGLGHVDAQLDRKQMSTMRRLQYALDRGNYRLNSGRHVHTRADAVRWLLEQIGGEA